MEGIESIKKYWNEGYQIGKKERLIRRFFTIFFSILIGLCLGYAWAYNIYLSDKSHAEKQIESLEQEFHQAIEKPRSFLIFNSQFKVWPVKAESRAKRFHFQKVKK